MKIPLILKGCSQKKVLSLVLCLAMMLSVMVVGAGAAFSDQSKIKNTEAVDACTALNIIGGYPDGSYMPEGNITRGQMCKMICVALNGGNDPTRGSATKSTFTDTKGNWAEAYIEACVAQGIVSGVGNNKFNPNGNVTGSQAAKMLLTALGFKSANEGFTGASWEVNVNVQASQKGIYDGLGSMDASKALTRDNAAQMVWNALQAYEVEYKTDLIAGADGKLSTQITLQDKVVGSNNDKITLMRDKYKAWINVGTLVSVDSNNLTISMSDSDKAESDLVNTNSSNVTFSKLTKDYSSLLGQKVKVLFKDGKTNDVMGVYAITDNTSYTMAASAVEKDGDKVKFDGKSYSVEFYGFANSKSVSSSANGDAIATYIDGVASYGTTLDQLDNNEMNPNKYTLVDTDDNGKIDTLNVTTYNVAQVTYASSDKIIAGGKTYKVADDNIAKGLAKDDWVIITENLFNSNKDIVKAEMSSGKVTGLRDNKTATPYFDGNTALKPSTSYNEYQIDGTWYKGATLLQSNSSESDLNSVKAGNDVQFVVVNDVMFYIKRTSGTNSGKIDNVAVVVRKNSSGVNDEVKLAFFDGTTKTVPVDNDSGSGSNEVSYNNLQQGTAYEYSVSGGEYTFETLRDGIADTKYDEYYGDLTYRGNKTTANSGDGSATFTGGSFDGVKIDDNAQVILVTGSGNSTDTKKISGKQFKAMAGSNITANKPVYGFSGTMSGLNRIGALVVCVNNTNNIVKTYSNYGYIVIGAYKVDNSNIEYTFWNGTENVTVTEKKSSIADRAKGTVIGYDTLKDKVIDDVEKLDATVNNTGSPDITFTAITDVSSNDKTVQFATQPVGATTSELDVNNGTVFYIDSDADNNEDIGIASGNIKEAQKTGNTYMANALVIGDGDDIELLIVDQGEFLKNDEYKNVVSNNGGVVYGSSSTAKSVSIASINDVQVNVAMSQSIQVTTSNINSGKTVSASLTGTTAGLSVNATTIDNNGKAIVTLSGTPTTAGNVTLTVTVDGMTQTASFNVTPAASNIKLVVGTPSGNLTYKTAGNFTVDVSAKNAFGQQVMVDNIKKDNTGSDVKDKFTITGGGTFVNDAGETLQLTVAEKTTVDAADAGSYTATVKVGDQTQTFTFTVAKKAQTGSLNAVSAGDVTTLTLSSISPMTEITKDDISVTYDGSKVTVTAFNSTSGEITIDSTAMAGTKVIKVIIKDTANYTYTVSDTTVS